MSFLLEHNNRQLTVNRLKVAIPIVGWFERLSFLGCCTRHSKV